MRILQIRFENLNSLVGVWHIDLTHPAFASDGIFAITGPTGAGKTTILDAICLALYGRTPRLNKVTKSGNEIMSRQTGACFAEVTFETQSGRYRCHWSQKRARKKPGGELQAPQHEIANADSGEILESKLRDVANRIESATGMDFDRFTRSMLLAQGGFAAFLQAAPDERAPILEQITGTEIYSLISVRVHERKREEQEKLNRLQAETAGIEVLKPEQEQEMEQLLETKQKEETTLAAKVADTEKAIAWLTTIEGLKKERVQLAEEENKLQEALEAFQQDREKLARALRAASLDGTHATLTATRKQQAEDSEDLKAKEETLPGLEFSAKAQAEALQSAEHQTVRAKGAMKDAAPLWQEVRALDQKCADQEKAVAEGDEDCQKDAAKIEADKKARLEEQEKRAKAHETLALADAYLQAHAQDAWLIGELAGVEEQFSGLVSRQREIAQKGADQKAATVSLARATASLEARQKQSGLRKQELEAASRQIQQGKVALSQLLGDRLLREYRAEKETLLREMVFLNKIAALEDHRTQLEDGTPCPLCGALEHPFAEGNIPEPDQTEQEIEALTKLIRTAEAQEAALKKLEEKANQAHKNLTEAEKLESTATHAKRAAEKALADVKDNLEERRADFVERRRAVSIKLQPFGIAEVSEADILAPLESLRARLQAWLAQTSKKADIEKQLATLDSEIKRLGAVIETQSTALSDKQKRLGALKKELAAGRAARHALYGTKDPRDEELRFHKALTDAEGTEKHARDRHHELHQQWTTARAQLESLKARIDQREPALITLETEFAAALAPAGFSHEEAFLAARLPPPHRAELTATAKDLDERQTDLKARQQDRETRLASERSRKLTDEALEELAPRFKAQEAALKELRDLLAALKHKLREQAAAKERVKEKQTAIEAQKKESLRWQNLHELIGSSDGKKYRNFAQGLTFEMMVRHANRQLQKMTDRYVLVRVATQPLELNVIDAYQAGETRSTKNLSGGESFIVSLSLALGLSHMASKNVRVDSLFLDEGFGTLDEDALDVALDTLAGLQRDGKLIGVISHVPALKERISTQIQVTPQTGGRSQIAGPGCGRSEAINRPAEHSHLSMTEQTERVLEPFRHQNLAIGRALDLSLIKPMERVLEPFRRQNLAISRALEMSGPMAQIQEIASANQHLQALIKQTATSRLAESFAAARPSWLEGMKPFQHDFSHISQQLQASAKLVLRDTSLRLAAMERLMAGTDLERSTTHMAASYGRLAESLQEISAITRLPPFVLPGATRELYTTSFALETLRPLGERDKEGAETETEFFAEMEQETSDFRALLQRVAPGLVRPYIGAREALDGNNADRARHILISLRELWNHLLRQLAPDGRVAAWIREVPNPKDLLDKGKPTRRARLLYVCRELNNDPLTEFLTHDTQALVKLLDLFNRIHALESALTDKQLRAIFIRSDSWLTYILQISSGNF